MKELVPFRHLVFKPELEVLLETELLRANEVRLMRTDGDDRTPENIVAVFDWVARDGFWSKNILSPTKLRKQWDVLVLKKDNPVTNGTAKKMCKPHNPANGDWHNLD